MSHQDQDTNGPGQAGNSVQLEGAPAPTSPPEPSSQAENVGGTPLNPQAESAGGTSDAPMKDFGGTPQVRNRADTKQNPYKIGKSPKKKSNLQIPDIAAERILSSGNHEGQNGRDNVPESGTTRGEVKSESPEETGGIAGQPPSKSSRDAVEPETSNGNGKKHKKRHHHESDSEMREGDESSTPQNRDNQGQNERGNIHESGTSRRETTSPLSDGNNRVTNSPSVEPYDPQHDPNYPKFGVPIDTFSVNRHDQGEFMYWLDYRRERYYVVKVGSNEAPKYRIVSNADWIGGEPDIREDNRVSHAKFGELNRQNELGQHIYTWKDITAIRGVAWIDNNGEGLDGIDPRRKIWCSWSVTAPKDEKPVHQRLQIKNRSNGRRAGTFNYTLILCEVQKKGSEEKVECIINRNTYRSILRAGKAAADITLFIHADYAEKRHNGKISRKSPSPSRNFEKYLRQCSVAPDSWQEVRQGKPYHDDDDDDSDNDDSDSEDSDNEDSDNGDDVYDEEETDKESDTSEESGYESDSYSGSPQRSSDRRTHRTRSNRKKSPKYERSSRKREKNQLDEVLTMLKDLSERVRKLERREKKSKKGRKRD